MIKILTYRFGSSHPWMWDSLVKNENNGQQKEQKIYKQAIHSVNDIVPQQSESSPA
jgi:hypothetical protein